jgi:hypothetical protein
MANFDDKASRTSSASTLGDGARRDGFFKEKARDDEIEHAEDQTPALLPSEVKDEGARSEMFGRMNQNALNAMLENPLAVKSREAVISDARVFAHEFGMGEDEDYFVKGALVARNPNDFEDIAELDEEDKIALREEITHKWKQPFTLYYLVGISCSVSELISVMCSMAAVVQGMDETVVNGAQLFYTVEFNLQPPYMSESQASWLTGLINSAPYLACAVLGCWLTGPLNSLMGRRGVIFLSCFVAGGKPPHLPNSSDHQWHQFGKVSQIHGSIYSLPVSSSVSESVPNPPLSQSTRPKVPPLPSVAPSS